ncbi:valine-trna ligase [Phaffia rhodozyma]|uniref:Valine--tRNA ligase, mitochondrial n=1 Tax=Phaffia rhodozyma TaxID=264483 RepID=A0A0F7SVW6_PHARH|nr:valine-trna ligase [Phaffia rhodozyma]
MKKKGHLVKSRLFTLSTTRLFFRRIPSYRIHHTFVPIKQFSMSDPVEQQEQEGPSKSALKKAAKAAEKAAKAAAKGPVKPRGEGKAKEQKEKPKVVEEAPFVNTTPKGEKKDMTIPMSTGYNPTAVEAAWYDWWEKEGMFKPKMEADGSVSPKGTFVVPFPPPNVTGALHIGHALTVSIQDTLVRWNRMKGLTVLYAPGYDHAGISTQSVVEKRLWKDEKLTKHDLGREKFLEKVWTWKDEYQIKISNQLRRLGASFEWERVAFTLSDTHSKAVNEAFCKFFEDGLIYRENRLVNWCVRLNTTLSNLEVDQKTLTGRTMLSVPGYDPKEKFEFGAITSFAYVIEGSDERIIVATTRPETMLGDTAIAVHPDDPRYTHLHGKFAIHPFVANRKIPIVTDAITVDMAFGTGAVKITPAHDHNDYECGKRHNLEFINILNDDGTLNANAGEKFNGMKRFHARVAVIDALKEQGFYIETKDNPMSIPVCSKSGDLIEAIMKPQWWVNCQPLAAESIKRTRAGEMVVNPKSNEADWYRWMENMQDWCISRQLWWGHRCPAYLVHIEGQTTDAANTQHWVVGRTIEEATARADKLANGRKYTLAQDDDVLDTWFSSGLWPFAIMGWPEKTDDLKNFYPATLLETGWDIIFFWVARMVFFGIQLTDQMPFKEVFLHAMIRDAHGRKMSKSLGNVIDPLDVMQGCALEDLHKQLLAGNLDDKEIAKAKAGQAKDYPKGIPQCGTDALRFALCAYSGVGRDINLDILRVEGYRKFCNKLWNAIRFAMLKLDAGFVPASTSKRSGKESVVERWILHKLNIASADVNKHFTDRSFMSATTAIHNFWLYEFCDVYIEASKSMTDEKASPEVRASAQQTLYTCLDEGLRLLHPFMPYVTEELWQRLPRRPADKTVSVSLAQFPEESADAADPQAEADFDLVFSCTKAARSLASTYNIQSGLQVFVQVSEPRLNEMFQSQITVLSSLTKGCKSAEVISKVEELPEGCASELVNAEVTVHLMVRGKVDLDAEVQKLQKKIEIAKTSQEKTVALSQKPNIPAEVLANNADKLKLLDAEIETLTRSMEMFTALK